MKNQCLNCKPYGVFQFNKDGDFQCKCGYVFSGKSFYDGDKSRIFSRSAPNEGMIFTSSDSGQSRTLNNIINVVQFIYQFGTLVNENNILESIYPETRAAAIIYFVLSKNNQSTDIRFYRPISDIQKVSGGEPSIVRSKIAFLMSLSKWKNIWVLVFKLQRKLYIIIIKKE